LRFVASRHGLTEERDEQAKFGFAPLVLLAWYVPDMLLGISGAAEIEGLWLVVGFPTAAIYLAILLLMEWAERQKTPKLTADS
jgi:hypothetical protein